MKTKNSLWLRAGFMLFALSVVGSTVAVFSQANDTPNSHSLDLAEPIQVAVHSASPEVLPKSHMITTAMIADRTASCAEMISAKDKLRCLNKRIQLKRQFRAQEKGRCDLLGNPTLKNRCLVELDILSNGLRAI